MKRLPLAFSSLGLAAILLGGCTNTAASYPSLAIRDVERMTGTLTPAAPVQPGPAYVVPTGKIEDALAAARDAHARFRTAQPAALTLARSAAGAGVGSDAYSRALIALANLTALHSQTTSALADIDALEAEGAALFAPIDAVKAAQGEVVGLVSEQDAELDTVARAMTR